MGSSSIGTISEFLLLSTCVFVLKEDHPLLSQQNLPPTEHFPRQRQGGRFPLQEQVSHAEGPWLPSLQSHCIHLPGGLEAAESPLHPVSACATRVCNLGLREMEMEMEMLI